MAEQPNDPLDIARLESLVEEIGDRELVREAVRAFLDEAPQRVATIRTTLASGDPDELRSAAHALGSPASMLGAVEVASTCRALQQAATEGRASEFPGLVDAVDLATGRTARAMRDYVALPASL
jgi:HPt (histidine-containing phosphotransfer) domain-containing protein